MVSSLVISPASHHEHFIFLIHSSFCDTRTRSTIGTTRATPRTPSKYITHTSKLPQSTSCAIRESLWREDMQSGGNPRTTTPTGCDPKNLRLSQGSKITLEIRINYMMYRKILEKKITELRSPKKWEVFREIGTAGLSDSRIPETSHFHSQMHFDDDSVESIADSDLEDGELQKMLSSPTVCPGKLRRNPRCNGRAGKKRGKCTIHSSRSKGKFEVSFI